MFMWTFRGPIAVPLQPVLTEAAKMDGWIDG